MAPQHPRTSAVSRLVLALVLLSGGAAADVNRIVLRVNDEIATLYEFEQRRRSRIQEIQRADLPPERRQRLLADVGAQTMREMYEELLVLSRADQLDIRISDREVEAAVAQAKAQFGIESDEEFRTALAASGMTVDELGEQMRRNLMIREVMGREVQQKIQPDEFSRPRRLRVREVVIPDEAAASEEERAELADAARSALLAGEEGTEALAALADAGQITGVLELGWIERGDLEPALEGAIWDLEVGAISEPIAARGGRHVLAVTAEEEARLQPFGDVQEEIRNKLRAGRYETEMANYLAELEENSFVAQDPPPEAAGFRLADEREASDDLGGFGLVPEEVPPAAPEDAAEPEPVAAEPPE
jgi:parvulin-like peptidyl-prolyl isomerase